MGSGVQERWFHLCQLASIEQDSEKLLVLIREINRLLEEKEERLKERRSGSAIANSGGPSLTDLTP